MSRATVPRDPRQYRATPRGVALSVALSVGMLLALELGCAARAAVPPAEPAAARPFVLFDALLQADKPDLASAGFTPLTWEGDLWRKGVSHDLVDEQRVHELFVRTRPDQWYYLDIENWPVGSVDPATRARNLAKLERVIELARQSAPRIHLGLYAILPDIAYWPLLEHDARYARWLETNRALEPLAARVDAVFPSLYTFNDDLEGWRTYARETLIEARRYGKPVYAFLWPEFHDSNARLKGRALPPHLWRAELELCAQLADGVVIWGGWQERWNESAEWWQETRRFMQSHQADGTLRLVSPESKRSR